MINRFAMVRLFIACSFLFLVTQIFAFRCKLQAWFNTNT